jgi:hypothetical protein
VAGCCECGDESSGSCATELVSFSHLTCVDIVLLHHRLLLDVTALTVSGNCCKLMNI